jgi:hypothetical protein
MTAAFDGMEDRYMNDIVTPGSASGSVRSSTEEARAFLDAPYKFFNYNINEMHGIARVRLERLIHDAVKIRVEEQIQRIPMVGKLAGNQGITGVEDVEAIVPLLFEHTMYKSYPISFLGNRQFDKLTTWMDKLTSVDLSKVNAKGLESIDDWLDMLAQTTELDPVLTSGSTGTMSFIPKSKRDIETGFRSNKVSDLQTWGKPPSEAALHGLYHIIFPQYASGRQMSMRAGHYLKMVMCDGREDLFHPMYPERGSADLMWLGAQLRAAAAKGDASRVEVPPSLLARRAELEAQQAGAAGKQIKFIEDLAEQLRGERVYCMFPSAPLWQVAARGLERGTKCSFDPSSAIATAGGAKGVKLPDNWIEQICEFFGLSYLPRYYGMTEFTGLCKMCSAGRYHLQPWIVPFILDPDTSKLHPRKGVQKGRAAFFDVALSGQWGGIITGDELEVDFTGLCECGQTSLHISADVQRFGAARGGDDKITCAAAPQAHAEALEFLTTFK